MLVLQCGLSPRYVMDEMEFYEIDCIIDNIWRRDKSSWEQTRMVSYVTAQCQSSKTIDMKEMMPFYWEKNEDEKHIDTQEEKEAILREMKEMEKILNDKENNKIGNGK